MGSQITIITFLTITVFELFSSKTTYEVNGGCET